MSLINDDINWVRADSNRPANGQVVDVTYASTIADIPVGIDGIRKVGHQLYVDGPLHKIIYTDDEGPSLPVSVIGTYTWAQLQALVSPVPGTRAYVSDLGYAEFVFSTGIWKSVNPIVLGQSALPLILPPSGFVGANGAWNIGTKIRTGGTLPLATIAVEHTTGIPASGSMYVLNTIGNWQSISYTGVTSNTLTGCSGGAGDIAVGAPITTNLLTNFGSCFVYFPAGAVYAGSVAGLYYVVQTAGNAGKAGGTVYNNTPYSIGVPTIPTSLVGITSASIGAYTTPTAADLPLFQFTVPANLLGPNGSLECDFQTDTSQTAAAKTVKASLGGLGTNQCGTFVLGGGIIGSQQRAVIRNRGATSKTNGNVNNGNGFNYNTSLGSLVGDLDTSVSRTWQLTGNIAAQSDYIALDSYCLTCRPG